MATPEQPQKTANIGMIGLAVMGENLARNIERNGWTVAVYNRPPSRDEPDRVTTFMSENASGKFVGTRTPEEFVRALERPRKIILLVKAGDPVDWTIDQIKPFLEAGDIIIDGGNSYFMDTERREKQLKAEGVNYIGPGVAGHFVKMVHNGIEYGDMQLIAESYDIMRRVLGMSADEMADVFDEWNRGELESFLIEITSQILRVKDPETGKPLVDLVLDKAGQKGTGKWTSAVALDLGIPIPTINAAVDGRNMSSRKEERVEASKQIGGPTGFKFEGDRGEMIGAVRDALYASKICSYAQGMNLIRAGSDNWKWDINLGETARIWKGGCIIRARFLGKIKDAYERRHDLPNLLLDSEFNAYIQGAQANWRRAVNTAIQAGIPVPAFSASISYFDAYRTADLPLNLTQAQRDFFGSHTYQRTDRPDAGFVHSEWEELLEGQGE